MEHHLLADVGTGDFSKHTCADAVIFICSVYNVHTCVSVDSARSTLFAQAHLLQTLPLTDSALFFHIKWKHYQGFSVTTGRQKVLELLPMG